MRENLVCIVCNITDIVEQRKFQRITDLLTSLRVIKFGLNELILLRAIRLLKSYIETRFRKMPFTRQQKKEGFSVLSMNILRVSAM